MEGDEMEMTVEELQKWIRRKVKKNELLVNLQEKCKRLQSLLERRADQATQLLKLCESVAACEAIVKKQYSLLGWEYRETDSDDDDDDDNVSECGTTTPSLCAFNDSETPGPSSPTQHRPNPVLEKSGYCEKLRRDNDLNVLSGLKRQPVVVLTRLSPRRIPSFCPTPSPTCNIRDESSNHSDSDVLRVPGGTSNDSDISLPSFSSGSRKRKKAQQTNGKPRGLHTTSPRQAGPVSGAKSNKAKRTGPKSNSAENTGVMSKTTTTTTTLMPQAAANTNARSNTTETATPAANSNGVAPSSTASTLRHSIKKVPETPTHRPPGEIGVNMNVLARRRAVGWQRGAILEIVTKDDGRLKYKITFEDKGKSLVSGHHIAFDCSPTSDQLFVGARVVVKCKHEKPRFCPGIVAQVPSRKNHMRFMVFMDDHTPIYVGLPLMHLVCRPSADPLDDILDETHREFLRDYIKFWPCVPVTQYNVGEKFKARLDGVMETCEVLLVDCSLIQVIFEKSQRKDWIYRGSTRLEHIIHFKELNKERSQ